MPHSFLSSLVFLTIRDTVKAYRQDRLLEWRSAGEEALREQSRRLGCWGAQYGDGPIDETGRDNPKTFD